MSYVGNTPTQQAFTAAVDYFSGNASTTAFTLSRPVASVAQVQAVISNVPQEPGVAFTVSGSTITFTSAPPSGSNNIYVYYTSPTTQVVQPGQGTVGNSQMVTGAAVANIGYTPVNKAGDTGIGSLTFSSNAGVTFANSGGLNNQLLNDYEYGSFNPTFIATGSTFSYAYQAGYYTKVGKVVTVMIALALNGSGNTLAGNALTIGTLPFTAQGGLLYWHATSCVNWGGCATSMYNITANCNTGTTITLNKVTAASTGPGAMLANDLSTTAGTSIIVSITYSAAS